MNIKRRTLPKLACEALNLQELGCKGFDEEGYAKYPKHDDLCIVQSEIIRRKQDGWDSAFMRQYREQWEARMYKRLGQ